MNNKRIIKNISISLIMKPISMLLSILYTPICLKYLGEVKYGVWVTILNVISWINYFDIGIGNGLRNRLTEAISEGNEKDAKTFVSTAYVGTAIISTAFCIIMLSVWNGFDLSNLFHLNMDDENSNFIISVSIIIVCINFVLSLSKTSAYAIQQPSIISIMGVVGQAVQIIVLIIAGKIGSNKLIVISIVYGVVSLFDSIVIFFIVKKNRNYLIPSYRMANMLYFKPLLSLGAGFFILQISSLVLNTTDNLLISGMYGSADVTPYNMVYKFFYMLIQIHSIIILPLWSAYTEAAAKHDIKWIKSTIRHTNYVSLLLICLSIIGIFVFQAFSDIWLGKHLEYDQSLIIFMSMYVIAQIIANSYSSFLCGVGHIRISVIIATLSAIFNIPLSIIFAKHCNLHLSGIILGSLTVMLISTFSLPVVSKKWIKKQQKLWAENKDD